MQQQSGFQNYPCDLCGADDAIEFFERWHRESVHYVRDWAR